MAEFMVLCHDKPDSLPLRQKTREAHLAYVRNHDLNILIAGPLMDNSGSSVGSLFIIGAENQKDVERFCRNDPYAKAGLFDKTEISPFRFVFGTLVPSDLRSN